MSIDRLPTLTEVLEVGREPAPPDEVAPIDLVAQVLAVLAPRVESVLEDRLRAALAPALAQWTEGLIRDARGELALSLRAMVEEAVGQVVRQRTEVER